MVYHYELALQRPPQVPYIPLPVYFNCSVNLTQTEPATLPPLHIAKQLKKYRNQQFTLNTLWKTSANPAWKFNNACLWRSPNTPILQSAYHTSFSQRRRKTWDGSILINLPGAPEVHMLSSTRSVLLQQENCPLSSRGQHVPFLTWPLLPLNIFALISALTPRPRWSIHIY
jgi:hypothetical protein